MRRRRKNYQVKGQLDLATLFRERCQYLGEYYCTHYHASHCRYLQEGEACESMCCYACEEKSLCGYACNACRKIKPNRRKAPRYSWDHYGITKERHRELTEAIRSGKHSEAAWSAAMQADEKIARHILKSVLQEKSYDKIEFDLELGRICVCRTDFYGIRRYFYYLFDKELKNGEKSK